MTYYKGSFNLILDNLAIKMGDSLNIYLLLSNLLFNYLTFQHNLGICEDLAG